MNVGELKEKLKSIPDKTQVVVEELHDSIPPDRLEDGEYDDYGGMPTGRYKQLSRATHDKVHGRIQLDFL